MADREVRAILTGSSAGAVKAFSETAVASEGAGKSISKAGENASSAFSNSLTKAIPGGEKVASMLEGLKNPYVLAGVAAVTAAVVIGGAAIDMANKYDDSTAKMAARTGQTIDQAKKVGDAFLTTAGQSTFSAQTMMDAYGPVSGQFASTAGHALSASDALKVMTASGDLAEATGQNLTDTTAALAQVMQAYGIQASGASNASDILFNSSNALGVPVGDLVNNVDKLKAKLGPLSPSLSDTSALMLDMAQHGLSGRAAMGAMSTGMQTLLGGTAATNDQLKSLGVSVTNANGTFVGMQGVIGQLQPKLAGMTEAQRLHTEQVLFGSTAGKELDATIMGGTASFNAATTAVNKTGAAHAAATTATSTLGGSMDKIKSAFVDVGIQIGQKLLPIIQQLLAWFAIGAQWFASILPTALQVLGNVFSVVFQILTVAFNVLKTVGTIVFQVIVTEINIFIAVVRTIVTVVSAVVTAVSAVIHTLAPIFAAVFGAIAAVVTTEINVVSAVVSAGWAVISTVFRVGAAIVGAVIGGLVTTLQAIWKVITTVLIQPVSDAVSGISGFIGNIVGFFTGLPGRIVGGLAGMGATIWNTISGEFGKVTSGISGWITTAISWFTGLPGRMAQGFVNMGGDLAQGFKTAVNDAVINPIDTALKWIGDLGGSIGPISFHIRDAFGGSMPQIPRLAMGGIVSAPTLALIGEAGPEAVVPLDRHPSSVGLGGDTHNHYYQITVTGADPNAVVLALKRYMQRNGSVPIKLAS